MSIKALLFDLDGTLLDTITDIANACNNALAESDLPQHPVADYKKFVGDGLRILIERATPYGTAEELIETCYNDFHRFYKEDCFDETAPYQGILEMLSELHNEDFILGVLSNKPHVFVIEMVKHYFPDVPFTFVAGQQDHIPKKPDPAGAINAAQTFELDPDEVLYIGDSSVDMLTAGNSGMTSVGVSWGFRPVDELVEYGADIIVDSPYEILEYCLENN
ncbi:MAG: HAD family hydrolase [Desulfotalea sp.]